MFQSNGETHKLRFYVGHDGSMIRLAAGLGIGKVEALRWPGLGSEIVFEVSSVVDAIKICLLLMHLSYLGMANGEKYGIRSGHTRGYTCSRATVDRTQGIYCLVGKPSS